MLEWGLPVTCFRLGAGRQSKGGVSAIGRNASLSINLTEAYRELVQIGIALTNERDLSTLLERILTEARRFTRAEAGTLFLRENDVLRIAAMQNDRLQRRLGEHEMRRRAQTEPRKISEMSVPGYVAILGEVVNIPDADAIPADRLYAVDSVFERGDYRIRSMLVVPLQEPGGEVVGVVELVNALDQSRVVTPFDLVYEDLVRSLASQAAVAIRNARLEDLSFKDALTDVYNRRYFMVRIEEEWKRHSRFAEPVSLVLLDFDHFKQVNDRFGHRAGDEALREVARLLMKHSRNFTVVTRFGGDEFAVLLVNTPKAGALTYARRIREVIAQHAFAHGEVTVSLGVASLPEDAANSDDLVVAADRAMYEAKRRGRNRVAVL